MPISVTKKADGSGFQFASSPLTAEEARKIDIVLSEAGFELIRTLQEEKAPAVAEKVLIDFYGDVGEPGVSL